MSELKLVTRKELKTVYGIPYCDAHINRLIKLGKFPPKRKLSPGRVAWLASDIEAWIQARLAF
jgi:prophage regulatory protein